MLLIAGALGVVVRPCWVITAAAVAACIDVVFSGRYW
jgi:hypothetical protein